VYVTLPGGTSLPPTSTFTPGGHEVEAPVVWGIGGGSILGMFLLLFFGLRKRKGDDKQ
jgi:hypothetical protein